MSGENEGEALDWKAYVAEFHRDRAGDGGEDLCERFGDREQAHEPAFHAPDLPPSFDRRRMPSMRMPRSAALTIS